MQHQRQHSRQPCNIATEWSAPLRQAGGRIRNISNGGAFMSTQAAATIGESITVYMAKPESPWCLRTHARVTRSDPDGLGLCWKTPWSCATLLNQLEDEAPSAFPAPLATALTDLTSPPGGDEERRFLSTLRQLGHLVRADRCSLFRLGDDRRCFQRLCDWCTDDIAPSPVCPDPGEFSWLRDQLCRGLPFIWTGGKDLPAEAADDRLLWAHHGIQSLMALPLMMAHEVMGVLVMDTIRARGCWPDARLAPLGPAVNFLALAVGYRRIERKLRHQQHFWERLLDTIPVPVFHKDAHGRYQGCNKAFARRVLGMPKARIVGCSLFDLPDRIPHHLAVLYHRQDQALIAQRGTQTYEAQVRCADEQTRDFLFTKAVYEHADGDVAGLVGVMLDITARKRTEAALIESEARYRRLFEDAALGIFQSTLDGRVLSVNPSMARIFGYASPADLMASVDNVAADLYETPAERQNMIAHLMRNPTAITREIRFRRRDGRIFIGQLHAWKVRDASDRILYIEGFVEDISSRKRIEESLKDSERRLHDLSSQLLAAQENERRRISLEIHDDMGQNLAVLKLKLQSMSAQLRRDQPKLKGECRQVLADIDKLIAKARHLAHDLSPSIIDDLKLCATLRSMAADFGRLADIHIALNMDDIDDLFDREAQIVLYRICQEALNNIVRHARAKNVGITIRHRSGRVHFRIEDDGRGFNPQAVWRGATRRRGMGLAAMAERARMLEGSLVVDSAGRGGTRIKLDVPVHLKGKEW